jgi:ankyrin repeat protein
MNEVNIDLDLTNYWGSTPLTIASQYAPADIVKMLVARPEVEVNSRDGDGDTALACALARDLEDLSIVELLLTRADLDINLSNYFGETPLVRAAFLGYANAVRLLLQQDRLDILAENYWGETAISVAIENGHTDIVNIIIVHLIEQRGVRSGEGGK